MYETKWNQIFNRATLLPERDCLLKKLNNRRGYRRNDEIASFCWKKRGEINQLRKKRHLYKSVLRSFILLLKYTIWKLKITLKATYFIPFYSLWSVTKKICHKFFVNFSNDVIFRKDEPIFNLKRRKYYMIYPRIHRT